jgi:Zn-dependent alcohol dehydrogenase
MLTYPINFKAAILRQAKKPLSLETIRFEGPLKRGQVLVKIIYSGICGKQIDEILQKGGKDKFIPHLLGHEGVGLVLDVGPGVKKVKKNDQVILHWVKGKGINSSTPVYFDKSNNRINAGWVTTFNEYAVVSENRITKTNVKNYRKELALLGCAGSTGLSIAIKSSKISKKDKILVYGCGGVGQFIVQGAKLLKAAKIIVVDKNINALKLAKKNGADIIVNSKSKNYREKIKNISNKYQINKVYITVGKIDLIEHAISLAATPGQCYVIGVPYINSKLRVNAFDLMHEKNLYGSLGGGFKPDKDIPKYLKLNDKKLISLSRVVSETIEFNKINLAIKKIMKNYSGKIIIKF